MATAIDNLTTIFTGLRDDSAPTPAIINRWSVGILQSQNVDTSTLTNEEMANEVLVYLRFHLKSLYQAGSILNAGKAAEAAERNRLLPFLDEIDPQ